MFADIDGTLQVKYYGLIEIGEDETADGLVNVVWNKLEEDGLLDTMRARLLGVVSDSAPVMVGQRKGKGGFTKKLGERLHNGVNKLIAHGCLAHKQNLMIRNAMNKKGLNGHPMYYSVQFAELDVNAVATYHSQSHKVTGHLRNTCSRFEGVTFLMPRKIHKERWVGSSFLAYNVVDKMYPVLVRHVGEIIDDPCYSDASHESAADIDDYLHDKNAQVALYFTLDNQVVFKGMAEEFQKKGISIIGQKDQKVIVLAGLDKVKAGEGPYLQKYLAEAQCGIQAEGTDINTFIQEHNDPFVWTPCITLERYENALEVTYKGETLSEGVRRHTVKERRPDGSFDVVIKRYERLSSYKDSFINTIKELVEKWMPNDLLMEVASILDQTKWPNQIEKLLEMPDFVASFKKWPKVFNYPISDEEMQGELESLVRFLKSGKMEWCFHKLSSPTNFWNEILLNGL